MSDETKIACIEVTRPETHAGLCCIYRLKDFDIQAEMDGEEDGGSIVLTLRMMTEQEVKDLPDFDGW